MAQSISNKMYFKAKKVLGEDPVMACIALRYILVYGFEWAREIDEDYIKDAWEHERLEDLRIASENERIKAENARLEAEGALPKNHVIETGRINSGMYPRFLETCKEFVHVLECDEENYFNFVCKYAHSHKL